ncbi:hypothetical protein GCM10023336_53970 [Streptomyces similanensis]|uniref:Uncharacterized protein n=1 Tax=Streptomyces similanensis TaxID=1274988 RepID=A0ABP9L274_9ACTN
MGLAVARSPRRLTTDALAATISEGIRVRCGLCPPVMDLGKGAQNGKITPAENLFDSHVP